jgi:hypothetical protein
VVEPGLEFKSLYPKFYYDTMKEITVTKSQKSNMLFLLIMVNLVLFSTLQQIGKAYAEGWALH